MDPNAEPEKGEALLFDNTHGSIQMNVCAICWPDLTRFQPYSRSLGSLHTPTLIVIEAAYMVGMLTVSVTSGTV